MEQTLTELVKIRDKLNTFLENDIEYLGEYQNFHLINDEPAFYLSKSPKPPAIKLSYLNLPKDQKQNIRFVCYRIIKQRERYKKIQSEIIRKLLGDDILGDSSNEKEHLIVRHIYDRVIQKRGSAKGAVREVAYLLDKPELSVTMALNHRRINN